MKAEVGPGGDNQRCPACGLTDSAGGCAKECPIGRGAVARHVYDEIVSPLLLKLHTAAEEVATANAAAHDMRELADEMTRQRDSISLRLGTANMEADVRAENRDLRAQFQDIANQTGPRLTKMRAERDSALSRLGKLSEELDYQKDTRSMFENRVSELEASQTELREALRGVLQIADRKHDAFDRAHAALRASAVERLAPIASRKFVECGHEVSGPDLDELPTLCLICHPQ